MPGDVESDQVLRLAGQSLPLMTEITAALQAANAALSDLSWIGVRLGHQWTYLSGAWVQPYRCSIGGRTLTIEGTLRFFNNQAQLLDVDDPRTFDNARFISENAPLWKWT
jgi:hypothetical protein